MFTKDVYTYTWGIISLNLQVNHSKPLPCDEVGDCLDAVPQMIVAAKALPVFYGQVA